MITIPLETFESMTVTIGNTLYMSGVPMNKLTNIVDEILQSWELYNPESELFKLARDYIIKGYNDFASYSKNVIVFPDKRNIH